MVTVCLPGTGGMVPLEQRWLTCCWIEVEGKAILIDCGEGTQIALKQAGCKLSRLNALFITHFHADHIAGLPGLLLTLGNFGKTTPLTIAGPAGLEQVVSNLCVIAPNLPFPLELIELDTEQAGSFEKDQCTISYLPLKHSLPCLGYRIAVNRMPIFNPKKAEELGVPKPLYNLLHTGHSVELKSGKIIEPNQVLNGGREPIIVCYLTDTQPFDKLTQLAQNADLLISEGMYGNDEMRSKMQEKGHMLFSDSALLAKQAGVKWLWLTHYSPALQNPEQYLETAQKIFPNTVTALDGFRISLTKE